MLTHIEPLFRPPAEAGSLILQVTQGCSHNGCRFCGMYKMKRFSVGDPARTLAELTALPAPLLARPWKVFLADGDAPAMGFAPLRDLCRGISARLPALRRIAAYASPADLLAFSPEQWASLRDERLSLLYVGLESGDDGLLAFIRKGNDARAFIDGVKRVRSAGLKVSATAVLGLGGRRFSAAHAEGTAHAANEASPEFFSLLTLIPGGNDAYLRELDLLSRGELLREARAIIERLACRTIFRTDHASNFADLGGTLPKDRDAILARADALLHDPALARWRDGIPQFQGEMGY